MPDNPASKTEKRKLIDSIRSEIRQDISAQPRRPDWWVSADHSLSFFVTFSKSGQLFYDVNQSDLEKLTNSPKSYVIFVLGHHSETLIVPAKTLYEQLKRFRRTTDQGNYKLHVLRQGSVYHFQELHDFLIDGYYNNFSQLKSAYVSTETVKNAKVQVALDPDVAEYFDDSKSVNDVLRGLIKISESIHVKSA